MSVTRERFVAGAALVLSVLVMATSVEIGRNAIEALLTAVTTYGTSVLAAALVFTFIGAPVGIRSVLKATRTVVAVAVVVALVLYGMGRAVVGVFV
ncbi:hypothetical protein ABZT45_34700 [Streptomyces sp. NPDC005356]|uniref:hypothetical protein n=1 Tax=Streptomyces sp. NPDC005356 TaxID=3157167 RepID=UPI0033B9464E